MYTTVSLAPIGYLACGRHSMHTAEVGVRSETPVSNLYTQSKRQLWGLNPDVQSFAFPTLPVPFGWGLLVPVADVFSESCPEIGGVVSTISAHRVLTARGGCDLVFLVIKANFYYRIFSLVLNTLFGEHCPCHTYIQSFVLPNQH